MKNWKVHISEANVGQLSIIKIVSQLIKSFSFEWVINESLQHQFIITNNQAI